MRVKIGSPKRWFGPYQLAEALCFWVPNVKDKYGIEDKPDWVHKFGEWLAHGSIEPEQQVGEIRDFAPHRPKTWLYRFLMWIDSKKQRTIKVHIDPWDTWNMDHTLALIILPMLKQLSQQKMGSPGVDDEDVPEELRRTAAPPTENEWDTDDNWHKRWDWVVEEMIFAFEHCVDESWEDQFIQNTGNMKTKKLENGSNELIFENTPQVDFDKREQYHQRIQRGLCLFGKYYRHLWS